MENNGLPQIYYLLLQGNIWCHDSDEFIGIYTNLDKLKAAYLESKEKLEEEQKAGFNSYCVLLIYKFDEAAYGSDEGIVIIAPKELWE